jgi:hypothetical protein
MMSPRERYQNDPLFHALVNALYAEITKGDFTPTEIRQAALLAHIKYNETHVGIRVLPKELEEWL